MKNPEIDASKIDSCHHDFKTQTVKCCCRAAKDPCNKVELVDDYLEIANTAAKENQQRILDGCRFHANISRSNEETCKIDSVRYDREMRCYGIFEFRATDKDGKDLIKPKLIKENCYWPHPQYHDQYSVFCSNAFFDIDDLVTNKCLSVVINDFTSTSTSPSMENNLHRTMILCCNSGVYPDRRESILSRSVVVL
uniref:Uncharacterized protein n=1 Tax=Panagrolaimus superbus TaxID=310955 RepID=A0A914XZ97_9BILA